jgi:hypothetical protein
VRLRPDQGCRGEGARLDREGVHEDCPECYAASVCATGEPFVSNTEQLVDLQGPGVHCVENGGGTPTKEEAKCEDGNSKALAKFVASKSKCYGKCNQNVFKVKIPEGSCNPPSPSNPLTQTCISKAESKALQTIDKVCFIRPAVAPACYDGTLTRPNSGAGWVALVESVVDSQIPTIACGSPSGAFLEDEPRKQASSRGHRPRPGCHSQSAGRRFDSCAAHSFRSSATASLLSGSSAGCGVFAVRAASSAHSALRQAAWSGRRRCALPDTDELHATGVVTRSAIVCTRSV